MGTEDSSLSHVPNCALLLTRPAWGQSGDPSLWMDQAPLASVFNQLTKGVPKCSADLRGVTSSCKTRQI